MFQSEDGIRDGHVTGVQTCALPISFPAPCRDDMDEPLTCENSLVRYGCIQYHHLLNLLEADRQMVDGVPAQGGQRDRVAIDPQAPSSSSVDTMGGGCSAPVLTIDGESGPGIYQ